MLIPDIHSGQTKHSWITFYNKEAEEALKEHLSESNLEGKIFNVSQNQVERIFQETSQGTGINITPQTLRSIFTREMSLKGVPDRYIDAFCGRNPQSVLAKHYSDFGPETLKSIYEGAKINILE